MQNNPFPLFPPVQLPARPREDSSRHILVVEDEQDIQTLLCYHLRKQGFEVESAIDGRAAWDRLLARRPALVVLDLMLPKLDGLSLLSLMRQNPALRATQVVILSARSEEEDVLKGLELGALDYVRKPFQVKELVARVKAMLRRAHETPAEDAIERPPLRIEPASHRATLDGRPLPLTTMEFALLSALASQPLRILSRPQLMNQAPDNGRETSGRNIDVHIRSLRKKLAPHDDLIETVRGSGYRFLPHSNRPATPDLPAQRAS